MVWIHGGAFAIHSSSNYGDATIARYYYLWQEVFKIPRNLCTKDIVFASLNYRLGALGFFSTGDDKCPGRYAFKFLQEKIR